ncbi:MAG: hypothetical protein O3A46_05225 [Candidatus Poribacteria bacterium]|nr:hypothetical protein [Candidatus Poribacteria bacterium]
MSTIRDILDEIDRLAREIPDGHALPAKVIDDLQLLVDKAESQKAVIAVLITSLLKKIESPGQDIRYHQAGMEKDGVKVGYSGRTIDTQIVSPYLQRTFPRVAPSESGWVTRSLEQPHPYTLDYQGKIRNLDVRRVFLSLLDDLENQRIAGRECLHALISLLYSKARTYPTEAIRITPVPTLTISLIVEALERLFTMRTSSFLPVIAVHTIYELLARHVERYDGAELLPLKSHTAADARTKSAGDIEVIRQGKQLWECVEVKHRIAITQQHIERAFLKIASLSTERYLIVTTANPEIHAVDAQPIRDRIDEIRRTHGCEFIVNGVIPLVKYYLRLLPDLSEFVNLYSTNLINHFSQSSLVRQEHVVQWNELSLEIMSNKPNR